MTEEKHNKEINNLSEQLEKCKNEKSVRERTEAHYFNTVAELKNEIEMLQEIIR